MHNPYKYLNRVPLDVELAQERASRSEKRARVALVVVFLLITACVALTDVLHAIE